MSPGPSMSTVLVGALVFGCVVCARAGTRSLRRRSARRVAGGGPPSRLLPAPEPFTRAVQRADFAIDPAVAWTGAVAGVAATAVVGGVVVGLAPALVVAGAEVGAVLALLHATRGRRDRAFDRHLPEALEIVARSLRAGDSLHQAIAEASRTAPAPVAAELKSVVNRTRHGEPLASSLDRWATTSRLPSVRLAAASLAIAAETGGASARPIDAMASNLRQRTDLELEVRVLSSQARTSAVVVGVAPAAFACFAAASDPRYGATLFRTRLGLVLLAAGLTLEIAGAVWMARMIEAVDS